MVGRRFPADASTFMAPLATWPVAVATPVKTMSTRPPSRSVTAGALPRYGTCSMSMPARSFRNSPAMWVMVPRPVLPKVSLPGRDLARSTNSRTELAGTCAPTANDVDLSDLRDRDQILFRVVWHLLHRRRKDAHAVDAGE